MRPSPSVDQQCSPVTLGLELLALSALSLPPIAAQQQTAAQNPSQLNSVAPSQAPELEITGRCVDQRTGEGLARCTVTLTGHMSTGYPLTWGVPEFINPAPIETGADGKFRFSVSPPHGWDTAAGYSPRIHITIAHPLRPSWVGSINFSDLISSSGRSCGDISLLPARRPVIRVLDTDGIPQEGVTLDLKLDRSAITLPAADFLSERGAFRLRSDQSGTFQLPTGLRPGTWNLSIVGRTAHGKLEPIILTDEEGVVVRRVITVLPSKGQSTISGRVIDSDQNPVANMLLGLQTETQHEPSVMARTNEQGRFIFRSLSDSQAAWALSLVYNDRHDNTAPFTVVERGTNDLALTIPAARTLPLSVQDDSGAAVEVFSVHAIPLNQTLGLSPTRSAGRFANGKLDLALRVGEWKVLVVAANRALAPSGWIEVEIERLTDDTPLKVALPRRILKTITVAGAGGVPLAGVTVRVFEGICNKVDKERFTTAGGMLVSRYPSTREISTYECRTPASGEVVVAGPVTKGAPATIIIERNNERIHTLILDAWDTEPLTVRCQ